MPEPEFTPEQEKILLDMRESILDNFDAELNSTKLSDERRAEIKDSIAAQRAEIAHDRVLVDHQLSK